MNNECKRSEQPLTPEMLMDAITCIRTTLIEIRQRETLIGTMIEGVIAYAGREDPSEQRRERWNDFAKEAILDIIRRGNGLDAQDDKRAKCDENLSTSVETAARLLAAGKKDEAALVLRTALERYRHCMLHPWPIVGTPEPGS